MLKRYYTLAEASEFLARERNEPFIAGRDIVECAARGELRLCFWFDGELGRFAMDERLAYRLTEGVGAFIGYLEILGIDDPSANHFQFAATNLIEPVEEVPDFMVSLKESLNRPSVVSNDILGGYNAITSPSGSMHVPFDVSIEQVLVPAADLLALRGTGKVVEKVNPRKVTTLHNIIGALLTEYKLTGKDGPLAQAEIIEDFENRYGGLEGISKPSMENAFSAANQNLKAFRDKQRDQTAP